MMPLLPESNCLHHCHQLGLLLQGSTTKAIKVPIHEGQPCLGDGTVEGNLGVIHVQRLHWRCLKVVPLGWYKVVTAS